LVVCISYCAVVASLGDNHSVTSSNSEAGTTDTA
jgi:DNA repair ATPase RecN